MPDSSRLSHRSCGDHREWQASGEVWGASDGVVMVQRGGVVAVWCGVGWLRGGGGVGFWGFRSFTLLCQNAQLFNQSLSTKPLNLQYGSQLWVCPQPS